MSRCSSVRSSSSVGMVMLGCWVASVGPDAPGPLLRFLHWVSVPAMRGDVPLRRHLGLRLVCQRQGATCSRVRLLGRCKPHLAFLAVQIETVSREVVHDEEPPLLASRAFVI